MVESGDAALKRMRMRSWRRGMKEMDLILGPFADARLDGLGPEALASYDLLLSENDQDLLQWMLGQGDPPDAYAPLIAEIAAFARNRDLHRI
ncbi:MAG: succinate dehydrogenase assembly factor 2 [Cereibacter sphaeroides]|uniref:FAD assembly factor SdhE n=1 Tax=Cereibacter sphaeroides TaxID=1063 RepID=A0A2W5SGY9_CERSP|nr:MAG: succinate dehydrogenase assembly factor 2 [Cereibacter sphaeroides]